MLSNLIKKINIKYLVLFSIVFILAFGYSCLFTLFRGDEIWNFGFSYNISNGMVIYRDFNVMQTPLFFFLSSIFINVFGNYLYALYILISILIAFIICFLYRIIGWKSFIILPFLFLTNTPSYNFLCQFFLFLILYLIYTDKDNDIVIAIIVGLMCLTKQSIGVLMFISFMCFSKNKFKSLCAFLIPVALCLIYLIINNALDEFFNYCVLGLFDFGEKNSLFGIYTFLECLVLIYLFFYIFKFRFKNKELFYILMFQINSYPIFDMYHFFISLMPVLFYFIKNIKSYHINCILLFIVYALFFVYLSTFSININNEDNFLYLLNDINNLIDYIEEETKNISLYDNKYDYSFYIMTNAYFRKLYRNIPINKYDFMLNGNMGYNGGNRFVTEINDICSNSICVFFVDNEIFENGDTQFSRIIYDYVINNYQKLEEYDYLSVYSNYNLIDSYKSLDILSN